MIVSIFLWFNSDTAGNNANFTRFIISLVSQNLCNFNFEVCFLLFMIKRDCVVFPRGQRADPALQWVFPLIQIIFRGVFSLTPRCITFSSFSLVNTQFPRGLLSYPAM